MDLIKREEFLLYSETDEHKKAVTHALDIIQNTLEQYNKCQVAYSGGKDSLVMLHMVLGLDPDVSVFHWDYGKYYVPRSIEQECLEIVYKIGVKNIMVESSLSYDFLKRQRGNVFYRVFFGKVLPIMKKHGYDMQFVGLREEESCTRYRKISGCPIQNNGHMGECYPLYKFTWRDVWAYIVSHNLKYCSHYDLYAPVIGWDQTRFATFFDPEFEHIGASNVDGVLLPEFKNIG